MSDKTTGLYQRFKVERLDGRHAHCKYLVLDLDHDPLAREAAETYAQAARKAGFVQLSVDIRTYLCDTRKDHDQYIAEKSVQHMKDMIK